MASIEELIGGLTAALNANTAILERVVAGQQAAIAKLEGGAATTGTRTRRSKAAEQQADTGNGTGDSGEAADTGSQAGAASPAAETVPANAAPAVTVPTDEAGMKAYVGEWTGSTEDADERAKRVALLKALAGKLGVEPKFAALVPVAKKAVFFIERAKALGTEAVDVEAAYDFDGSPSQEAPAAASDF